MTTDELEPDEPQDPDDELLDDELPASDADEPLPDVHEDEVIDDPSIETGED